MRLNNTEKTLSGSLADIRARIGFAQGLSPLASPNVTLLGASKSQPAAVIEEAINSGVCDFGENRVQEAAEKWPALRTAHPQVRLHLIGALQSNKAQQAVDLFDVIQTVDRKNLVDALVVAMAKSGKRPECYIQVNTGHEPQKAGVLPSEAAELIRYCRQQNLPLTGLMCVPPEDDVPAPHFALLRSLAIANDISGLSMGMSGDFEEAIRMGATCVRVGRILFGER